MVLSSKRDTTILSIIYASVAVVLTVLIQNHQHYESLPYGYGYNLPEKGVAVSPFRYYYWMLFVMTNIFCCGTPIRNGLPIEKKTKMYFRYI